MMHSKDACVNISAQLEFLPLLEALRVGRVFILNASQAIAMACIGVLTLATSPLLALLAPLSLPPIIAPPITLLFLFFYLPLLVASLLFTHANSNDTVMKNTPRKRRFVRKEKDEKRFRGYLAVRCCYVAVTLVLTQWAAVAAVYGNSNDLHTRYVCSTYIP
jgi:hypothetical protein